MSLSQVHVECGYSVVAGNSTIFHCMWSETIEPGQTTKQSAGYDGVFAQNSDLPLIYRVSAPDDRGLMVAIGAIPDATVAESTNGNNSRRYVKAGDVRDFPAKAGQKLATAASV
jgi:hypothetical protein